MAFFRSFTAPFLTAATATLSQTSEVRYKVFLKLAKLSYLSLVSLLAWLKNKINHVFTNVFSSRPDGLSVWGLVCNGNEHLVEAAPSIAASLVSCYANAS